jgi:hypothetical protein
LTTITLRQPLPGAGAVHHVNRRHSRRKPLRGTRSETEHAELLMADLVGRVDRLRPAEIGDRLDPLQVTSELAYDFNVKP